MSWLSGASVRARTTLTAVVVVAIALAAGALALVLLQRDALADGVRSTAEQRAQALAGQIERSGPPTSIQETDDDDLEDVLVQIAEPGGRVIATSQPLPAALPLRDTDADLDGQHYLVVTEDAKARPLDDSGDDDPDEDDSGDDDSPSRAESEYVVSVAASTEDVDDATAALVPLLGLGLPLVVLLVGGVTWMLTGRALRPVERIRGEVEEISGTDLHRRVPEPAARDEIQRLAVTMNAMLDRLEGSATRQRRFVADASHELRSPLASIRQAAEVSRAHPDALPVDALAETVASESVRMQRLVDQLLLLTRADEGRLVTETGDVDLDDLLLAHTGERDAVRIHLGPLAPARVAGDRVALGQVVRNLVDNAVRHADSQVRLSLGEDGGRALLAVDDDGAGVPAADRDRVFERFVRLDEARSRDAGGSGLGLAIVRDIVALHHGTVRIEDSDLGGARFAVAIPLAR